MSAKTYIVKLSFSGPLHIGADESPEIDQVLSFIHSDTLFSAIYNGWARLYPGSGKNEDGSLKELVGFKNGNPPFRLSSCFPYSSEKYYLPKPLIDPSDFEDEWAQKLYGKELKRTRFISLEKFSSWCKGDNILTSWERTKFKPEQIYREETLPRVTIDRVFQQTQLYHSSMIWFEEWCGLYFLVEVDENLDHKNRLIAVLKYLEKTGLGGEKSIGSGQFKMDDWKDITTVDVWKELWQEKSQRENDQSNSYKYCLLSLYKPKINGDDKECSKIDDSCAYSLIPRKGWFSSSSINAAYKRKSLWMLGEGSILTFKPAGELEDVTPDIFKQPDCHPIYRYGYAFALPMREVKNDH